MERTLGTVPDNFSGLVDAILALCKLEVSKPLHSLLSSSIGKGVNCQRGLFSSIPVPYDDWIRRPLLQPPLNQSCREDKVRSFFQA